MITWNDGMELKRKNINRGFTKLRVWEDAINIFKFVYKITKDLPYELSKSRNNILNASHSISRNIAEGILQSKFKRVSKLPQYCIGIMW